LCGGGDVSTVGEQDCLEDVAGLGDVVAFGDDAQGVGLAAARRGDVEPTPGGDRGSERNGRVDGVGLPAVVGRGVAETLFNFVVAADGLYSARLLWFEGGGDANVEWYSVDPATDQRIRHHPPSVVQTPDQFMAHHQRGLPQSAMP